jgi:di/tricarboxylate transporter
MSIDLFRAVVALVVLLVTIWLFVREKQPPEVVAMLAPLALLLTGVLTPVEAFSGFGHPATISVVAVLVLTAGLEKTGILTLLARRVLAPLGRSEWLLTIVLMLMTGVVSAFLVNTATVAVLIPVVIEVCRRTGARPGRILMPMAHAASFGGMCTLIGTSTNIICHEVALAEGLQGFSMFELGRVGLPLLIAGSLYILLIGRWFLPRHAPEESTGLRSSGTYEAEFVIDPDSSWVGRAMEAAAFTKSYDLELVVTERDGRPLRPDIGERTFQAGDHVRVRGKLSDLLGTAGRDGLTLHRPAGQMPWTETTSATGEGEAEVDQKPRAEHALAELVLLPGSSLIGSTLKSMRFAESFDAVVVAVHRPGGAFLSRPHTTPLHAGDILVVEANPESLKLFGRRREFLVIGEPSRPDERPEKRNLALAVVAAVVLAVAFNLVPLVTAASAGCAVLLLAGVLTPRDAWRAVDGRVVAVLAGALALGLALEKTGWIDLMAQGMSHVGGLGSPRLVLAAFFLVAMISSEFLSNSATAALLAPVALATADSVGLNPLALLAAVAFGSSAAFAMPIGYQTSLMIFGPGRYRVRDYIAMGIPLDLIFAILALWLIPKAWPVAAP